VERARREAAAEGTRAEFAAKQESLRMWNFYIRQMEKLDELRAMQAAGVETVEDYWREYQLCSFYDAEVIELAEKEVNS
jgi:hypothetical protein